MVVFLNFVFVFFCDCVCILVYVSLFACFSVYFIFAYFCMFVCAGLWSAGWMCITAKTMMCRMTWSFISGSQRSTHTDIHNTQVRLQSTVNVQFSKLMIMTLNYIIQVRHPQISSASENNSFLQKRLKFRTQKCSECFTSFQIKPLNPLICTEINMTLSSANRMTLALVLFH